MNCSKARLIALALALACVAPVARAAERPNMVVILTDDMGFCDLGCYGSEIRTPNLDRLAGRGLRFTQFYNCGRCCPTRASLLTGLYPHQAGVGHMVQDRGLPGYRGELNASSTTIAEALRPLGYRNYIVGKWHVTRREHLAEPHESWPCRRGFDRYYGTVGGGGGSYYDPASLVRDNTLITVHSDPEYKPDAYYSTHAYSHEAARFIREHKRDHAAEPFFLYVAYTAAHWPLQAPDEDIARYRGAYDAGYDAIAVARRAKAAKLGVIDTAWPPATGERRWEDVQHKAWEARCMEVYAAMVEAMDRGVGQIVEELTQAGMLDNTLIMYMQDNGGCAEATGRSPDAARPERPTLPPIAPDKVLLDARPTQTREGFPMLTGRREMPGPRDTFMAYGANWARVSNTPLRRFKHWVHEGGIATPLVVHWPARIKDGGALRAQPGHVIDILPTCLDAAGAGETQTPRVAGRSLLGAFAGQPIDRDALYFEHEGNRAIRSGDWKLVAAGPAGPWELYNLARDRSESENLIDEEPKRAAELALRWEAWARTSQVIPWIWNPSYAAAMAAAAPVAPAGVPRAFEIQVVDSQTGRGVPLVEVRTVDHQRLWTDSAGRVAVDEPELMGRKVFFTVQSHGYEFPADGFGYRGKALEVVPGGKAKLEIKRLNIAERLYRVTGRGIYRDSVLLGHKPPLAEPLLNAHAAGSDSVISAVFGGRIYWFWGDTQRPEYPLGLFHTTGATSRLPSDGGLAPDVGVDLTYFVDEHGRARDTARMPGEGPTWLTSLVALKGKDGGERLLASYMKIRNKLEVYERGIVEFDPTQNEFRRAATFPTGVVVYPVGHPLIHVDAGKPYVYFANPYPLVRVPADADSLLRPERYEAYTCLLPSSTIASPRIERDSQGQAVYKWRAGVPAVTGRDQVALLKSGKLKESDAILTLRDVASGKAVVGHAGTVSWNEYRRQFVMIATEVGGTSHLGEVWYAEADTPLGPWVYARKVVTHNRYSFYNPRHHPVFDEQGGRSIYFEGTYTADFSGNEDRTPRYEYNQMMYRLDLTDERLVLPVPVYSRPAGDGSKLHTQRSLLDKPAVAPEEKQQTALPGKPVAPADVQFFALDRARSGAVAVYDVAGENEPARLELTAPKADSKPVFYALPHDAQRTDPTTCVLIEYASPDGNQFVYSCDDRPAPAGFRQRRTLCRVWRDPAAASTFVR